MVPAQDFDSFVQICSIDVMIGCFSVSKYILEGLPRVSSQKLWSTDNIKNLDDFDHEMLENSFFTKL